ncbi:hypothetical protein K523DRAFT_121610 [Schizophyllum commune Tattone D]|nr:hypothetical protein K523DRAFT_121610 [Schizophyllum commune Tattone D]
MVDDRERTSAHLRGSLDKSTLCALYTRQISIAWTTSRLTCASIAFPGEAPTVAGHKVCLLMCYRADYQLSGEVEVTCYRIAYVNQGFLAGGFLDKMLVRVLFRKLTSLSHR